VAEFILLKLLQEEADWIPYLLEEMVDMLKTLSFPVSGVMNDRPSH
jgi:hypothetical protein